MDYLYGKLNNEIKYKEYKGLETATAEVTVDNEYNTFSVDVKRVPNKMYLTTLNGNTYSYDGSSTASFDLRTQVTNEVTDGNILAVESGAVKLFVDGKVLDLTNQIEDANSAIAKLNEEKLDKITDTSEKTRVYIIGTDGTQGTIEIDVLASGDTIAQRNSNGNLNTNTPTEETHATNKKYVDDADSKKVNLIDGLTEGAVVYATETAEGTTIGIPYDMGSTPESIVQRQHDGSIIVGTPVGDNQESAVNIEYADKTYLQMESSSSSSTHPSVYAVMPASDGSTSIENQIQLVATENAEQATLALRDNDGNIKVGEASYDEDAVNKKYADATYVAKGTSNKACYNRDSIGNEDMIAYNENATAWTIVQRANGGVVRVGTPIDVSDATTKKYVDDADAKKLDLTGGTITGSLAIQGDLTVTGTTTTEKAETLAVKDSVIITNADGAELGATLSGIAIRKDGENTYGVMYDPSSDSVKLGLGTLDTENKFTFNESGTDGKPIATRDDSSNLTDGDLVKWDGTSKSLIDSGKKVGDFVEKVTVTEGSNLAYIAKNDGTQSTYPITYLPQHDTIAQRTANGALRVGTAVEDSDAMPKKQVEDGFVKKVNEDGIKAYTSVGNNTVMIQVRDDVSEWSIPRRDGLGNINVGTPRDASQATTKAYVDALNAITITEGA